MTRDTKCQYGGVDVHFHLPFWFASAGRDVVRRHSTDKFGPSQTWNTAVESLARLKGVKETCMSHQCWVIVEFTCAPARLPAQIKKWQAKLDRFLLRWSKVQGRVK